MSMASRLAKWVRCTQQLGGALRPGTADVGPVLIPDHRGPAHRADCGAADRAGSPPAACPAPQTAISGMISPAFWTSTVSPTRMSFSVMIVLVVQGGVGHSGAQPSAPGSTTAFGVSTPVRPTCTTMCYHYGSPSAPEDTCRRRPSGETSPFLPRASRAVRLFTFTTAPSMSKGYCSRALPKLRICVPGMADRLPDLK